LIDQLVGRFGGVVMGSGGTDFVAFDHTSGWTVGGFVATTAVILLLAFFEGQPEDEMVIVGEEVLKWNVGFTNQYLNPSAYIDVFGIIES
jgi:hypothetical protein